MCPNNNNNNNNNNNINININNNNGLVERYFSRTQKFSLQRLTNSIESKFLDNEKLGTIQIKKSIL